MTKLGHKTIAASASLTLVLFLQIFASTASAAPVSAKSKNIHRSADILKTSAAPVASTTKSLLLKNGVVTPLSYSVGSQVCTFTIQAGIFGSPYINIRFVPGMSTANYCAVNPMILTSQYFNNLTWKWSTYSSGNRYIQAYKGWSSCPSGYTVQQGLSTVGCFSTTAPNYQILLPAITPTSTTTVDKMKLTFWLEGQGFPLDEIIRTSYVASVS